jgi:hypothetical protein
MFNTLVGQDMTEEQGWLFMALLKMVRSQQVRELRMDSGGDCTARHNAYFALAGEAAKASRGEAPQASGAIGPSILPDEEV